MFDRHYEVILADSKEAQTIHFRLRYLVYCMETGFEDPNQFPDGLERDAWDDNAAHFIVRSLTTGEWVAAMRIILPKRGQLPIRQLCRLDARTLPTASHVQFGELSRLCIVDQARRRWQQHATQRGVVNLMPPHNERREPDILMGLLRAAAAFSRERGISHWYYMTTAALARSVKRLNIMFKPVGPAVQHRGDRFPFLADMEESMRNISSISEDHAAMIARQTAYRLYSAVCHDEMSLPELPETIKLPVRALAVAK